MKKENKNAFFKGKGFYTALATGAIAICAVAIMGTHMFSNENKNVEQKNDEFNVAEAEVTEQVEQEEQVNQANEEKQEENKTDETIATNDTIQEEKDEQISDIGTEQQVAENEEPMTAVLSNDSKMSNKVFDENQSLVWPIKGEVVLNYSMDKPVYFKTLAQYKCNPALLIAGKEKMDVVSSAEGVITAVDKNEETGVTVTASVGDDYRFIYGQLADVKVKKGDQVKAGQVIGQLAKPTKYYTEEGTNLFFQVFEGEESVNPLLLLE